MQLSRASFKDGLGQVHHIANATLRPPLLQPQGYRVWCPASPASAPATPYRRRGFGIVRFPTKDAAEMAVNTMNNATIGGRVVSVRIDRFA
jgi:hypothetical protein